MIDIGTDLSILACGHNFAVIYDVGRKGDSGDEVDGNRTTAYIRAVHCDRPDGMGRPHLDELDLKGRRHGT